ncbi:unnamed protein product [Rotaria sordida]|uniref:B box-type domain-containing protein n=1 Tax=Rotaria sordida TaxID=392033 RepID=A0A814WTZ5_9BILA|nr:unnamed protein product [Rotaria sordida]CAF1439306.1 unnamed protein product [Rotaria sordida]CAF3683447.1 unnamed protein product [Rotaria sordida]CAF3903993.1 unnamed protein product [Rotaria sordida]
MASIRMKQTCTKCNKGGGIAMCHGCQQSFCTKHFIEHRQELSQQIDDIGQEHDLLRRDLNCDKNTDSLLEHINKWEQESIKTIQTCAHNARSTLQQLYNQTKNELKVSCDRLTQELRDCRESDDYTEIDIKNWVEKLKEFRQIIERPSIINIDYDNNITSAIKLIKVTGLQHSQLSFSQEKQSNENNNHTDGQIVRSSSEKFKEIFGSITLSTDGLTAWCSHSRWDGSCVSGIGRYSSKIHHIRFRIENKESGYWFFGIITASQELTPRISETKSTYGWWELGCTIVNGKMNDKNQTKIMNSGDEVTLILNCDNQLIQLHHHRTNTLVGLPIDLEQCPFPWKLVFRLDCEHDCIKILH